MVLSKVEGGRSYIIKAISGEGETRLHLEGMGFVPGTKIEVVSRMGKGVIVNVKGSRVALDQSLVESVIV